MKSKPMRMLKNGRVPVLLPDAQVELGMLNGELVLWSGGSKGVSPSPVSSFEASSEEAVGNIPTLVSWLDASDLTYADGGSIEDWPDKSENGNIAFQASPSNRPTLTSRSLISGMPAAYFNGASQWLKTGSFLSDVSNKSFAVFAMIRPESGAAMSWLGLNSGDLRFSTSAQQDPFYATGDVNYLPNTKSYQSRIMGYSFDGETQSLWCDGARIVNDPRTDSLGISGLPVSIGSRQPDSANVPFDGDIAEVLIFDGVPSDAEIKVIHDYLNGKYYGIKTPRLVVFEGDSLTYGEGTTDGTHYPAVTTDNADRTWHGVNIAKGAARIGTMLTEAANQVAPLYNPSREHNVIVVWSSNGLEDVGVDETHDQLALYCQSRRDEGWTVFVCNALPRTTSGYNALRNSYNALINANYSSYADELIDLASDPNIGDDSDASNLTYFDADGIHLVTAGYSIVAGYVTDALNDL